MTIASSASKVEKTKGRLKRKLSNYVRGGPRPRDPRILNAGIDMIDISGDEELDHLVSKDSLSGSASVSTPCAILMIIHQE